MIRFKYIIWVLLVLVPIIAVAKEKTITVGVTSEPSGAMVFVDGKKVGTTPCKVKLKGNWVYDIDANKVNTNKPPYSKKFTFVLDGYEPTTEYWEGTYEYHEGGFGRFRQKYYIVKPNGYTVMAVLKKDAAQAQSAQAQSAQAVTTTGDEFIMRCNIDSDPEEARVFWRIISQDSKVMSTEQQYLGKTPYKEQKSFRISGLTSVNAKKINIELIVKKKGYYDTTKVYSLAELLGIMEINGFFEMETKE